MDPLLRGTPVTHPRVSPKDTQECSHLWALAFLAWTELPEKHPCSQDLEVQEDHADVTVGPRGETLKLWVFKDV